MSAISVQTLPSSLLSSQEVSKATDYLVFTRDNLLSVLSDLSDSQWRFRPDPDAWSIADVLEHLALIESRVHGIVAQMPNAPAVEPDRIDSQVEATILAAVPNRSNKFKAPPFICPSQQCSPEESLARFLERRARTIDLLVEAPALRGHVIPHPILGPWDGYQWILAVSAHCARHTEQMLELKACREFPGARPSSPTPLN